MDDNFSGMDRRQNYRVSRELLVQFKLIAEAPAESIILTQKGFLRNISAGGALLEAVDLDNKRLKDIVDGKIKVALEIEIPSYAKPVKAVARAVWCRAVCRLQDA